MSICQCDPHLPVHVKSDHAAPAPAPAPERERRAVGYLREAVEKHIGAIHDALAEEERRSDYTYPASNGEVVEFVLWRLVELVECEPPAPPPGRER